MYDHFAPLRKFADQVPWTAGPWKPVRVEGAQAIIYGLTQDRHAVLWIHNPDHHWRNVFDKKDIRATPAHEIRLLDCPPGAYQVTWWNTWTAQEDKTNQVNVSDGALRLEVPSMETDCAVVVRPAP